jgi:hypothetical protein
MYPETNVLLLFFTSYCAFFILKITIHTVTLDNIEEVQRSLTMLYASIIALWSITKIWEMERKIYIIILTWQSIKLWIYTFEYNISKSKVKHLSLSNGLRSCWSFPHVSFAIMWSVLLRFAMSDAPLVSSNFSIFYVSIWLIMGNNCMNGGCPIRSWNCLYFAMTFSHPGFWKVSLLRIFLVFCVVFLLCVSLCTHYFLCLRNFHSWFPLRIYLTDNRDALFI